MNAIEKIDVATEAGKKLMEDLAADARKTMDWQASFMIIHFVYAHHILGIMVKDPTWMIPTMGVSVIDGGRVQLLYNPQFVMSCKDEELTYVLFHEVMHISLHHCTCRQFDDKEISNIAHDLAVNEIIPVKKGLCEPPVGPDGKIIGVHVSEMKKNKDFSDIEEHKTAEWYYDYLLRKKKEGKIGGCKGCPAFKEGKCTAEKLKPGESADGKTPCPKSMDDHGGWKEDEVADERVRAKVRDIERTDSWGDLSGAARETIIAAQARKINWRNLLRQFYGNMSWHDRETTRKRPNRRTGIIHPGARKNQVDRHLVAIDTSGSVDSEWIGIFIAVLNNLIDYVPIDLMQFDCEKQTEPRPYDRRHSKIDVKGRGGTDFQPVINETERRKYKSVLILTDGCASAPTQPSHAKVVWVLMPGCKPPVDWGMRVTMDKHS